MMLSTLSEDELIRLIADEVMRQFEADVGRSPVRVAAFPTVTATESSVSVKNDRPTTTDCACSARPSISSSAQPFLTSPQVPDGIPIGVSVRHIHLCRADCNALFGPGYELRHMKELYQHNQFACQETLTVVGPKGVLPNVRILVPLRNKTQVEVSRTDAIQLGCNPPILSSVNEGKGLPCALVGPRGSVVLEDSLIRVWRHMHLSDTEASSLGLKHGDEVDVKIPGSQGLVFCNTRIRTHPDFRAEMHIDTDEGNAAGIC